MNRSTVFKIFFTFVLPCIFLNDPEDNFDISNRFTGQIYDEDTGLYYYGARYYDAELSRFIQPDTIFPADPTTNSQALNRYTYAYNNPLVFTDPTGNVPISDEEYKKWKKQQELQMKNYRSINLSILQLARRSQKYLKRTQKTYLPFPKMMQ